MNKNFYFMAGLPRSGGTLLSSILNQNPEIFCSLSPMAEILDEMNLSKPFYNYFEWDILTENCLAFFKNSMESFYSINEEKYIIDRNRIWGTPYHESLLKKVLEDEPKIIHPVRPLKEIITSFIVMARENENNYIDKNMIEKDFLPYWRKPIDDARADWLLSNDGFLSMSMLSLHNSIKNNKNNCLVINYDDLVNNTEEKIVQIYSFLNIEKFVHDFSSIDPSIIKNDEKVYGIPDLHKVRTKIEKKSLKPEDVLSDYILSRCEIEDFWTGSPVYL